MISHEQSQDKTPVGLKTDSVISNRSSSRGGEPRFSMTRTTTNSTLAEKPDTPFTPPSATACRNGDWRALKQSLKGLWKSAHGVKRS